MRSWIDPGCDPSRRASRRNASRRSASRRSGARFATPAAAPNVASGGCRNCWKLKLRHAQRSINDAMQEVHWRRPMSSHLSRIAATSAESMDGRLRRRWSRQVCSLGAGHLADWPWPLGRVSTRVSTRSLHVFQQVSMISNGFQ